MARCFAKGCREEIAHDKFGCMEHWYMLPKEFRDEVYDAFYDGDRNRTLELVASGHRMSLEWANGK